MKWRTIQFLVRYWAFSVGCSTFQLLGRPYCCAADPAENERPVEIEVQRKQPPPEDSLDRVKKFFHKFEAPQREITIETNAPPREDSLDRFKKLMPKRDANATTPKLPEDMDEPQPSVAEKVVFQLRDYNWEQNVNFHIGSFTLLGYRDANSNDRMLFRFLTTKEHAEKRVMNSKASLLYIPPKKRPPM